MVSISRITAPIKNTAKTLYNNVPSVTVAKNKVLNSVEYIGRKWTSPQQRLIMGATAIITQPFIDAHNKRVNEDTRRASVARTMAKIIVGTTTGFFIRYLCIKGIKYSSKPFHEVAKDAKPLTRRLQTLFTPEGVNMDKPDVVEQYRNALGTFISLGIMTFTNFAVDAPWTKKLTNAFVALDQKMRGENKS